MNTCKTMITSMLGIGLLVNAGSVRAAEQPPAAGSPDAAMMAQAQKYMTPGEQHKALNPLIGSWTCKVNMWMKPGDAPQTSEGTAENTWVLNNHFVKQEFTGTWGGQPFAGIGYTGYDNVRGEYQSSWMDSMGTGMMLTTGNYTGKVLHQSGTFGCPMTGEKNMWQRSELRVVNPNKLTYTSYGKDSAGKEFKAMEIVYSRAK